MKPRTSILAMAALAAALTLGRVAAAQEELVAVVPFDFDAAGIHHEKGRYEVHVMNEKEAVTLTSATHAQQPLLVITRLAAPEVGSDKGRLVFDVVGDKHTLSEVWIPREDGFLLHATKGRHTHRTTGLESKAK